MRRFLRLGFDLALGSPAWVVPGIHVHDEHEEEGIMFYAFGSTLTVRASFRRSW